MSCRAKFTCYSETRDIIAHVTYKFRAVYGVQTFSNVNLTVPCSTGKSVENDTFYNTTPNGQIELTINPNETSARFEIGADYYIDFIKVE